ncbi:MAG TPA: hypothetical protein VGN17_24435 [Bryobacteraceae bacterium]
MGEGSGELAVKGDVVAEEEFGRTGGGGAAQGEEELDGFGSDGGVLEGHVAVESGFLGSPDAELAPARGGHGFDEKELGLGGGLVFGDEVREKGGIFLALGGGGAAGAGAVAADVVASVLRLYPPELIRGVAELVIEGDDAVKFGFGRG